MLNIKSIMMEISDFDGLICRWIKLMIICALGYVNKNFQNKQVKIEKPGKKGTEQPKIL